jgi:hypothetical protein
MTMFLLAGCASAALLALAPSGAHAQIPVTDAIAAAQQEIMNTQMYQQVAQAISTVRQLQQSYQMLTSQYNQLVSTYNAIVHATSVQGLASGLGRLSNGLGATEIGGLMNGVGSLAGTEDQIARMRILDFSGSGVTLNEIDRRLTRIGSTYSMAQQGIAQTEQRLAGLQELMRQIDSQPDLQASAALQNRIQGEVALINAQQQQYAQLQLIASAQAREDEVRAEIIQRTSVERWRDSLAPLSE